MVTMETSPARGDVSRRRRGAGGCCPGMGLAGGPGPWGLRLLVLLGVCLRVTPQAPLPPMQSGEREYCEREEFNATCGNNEVVLMQSARYGRMRAGRCITGSYGKLGCYRDVLAYLDEKCSGRRSCTGTVGALLPLSINPCPGDFRSYMEASYTCVKVASSGGNTNLCKASTHVAIRSQEGYLSNFITETSRLGSLDCPWLIEMHPGQTIRLTLLDFGGRQNRDEKVCHVYATIKEAAASMSETVCARRERSTNVYESTTNVVEVRLVSKRQDIDVDGFYFLIKYEAIGCMDPKKPTNGWVERRDSIATVGCSFSDDRWNLRCDGNRWIGSYGNCTGGDGINVAGSTMWGRMNFPSGLSIILIMCIALFIGIVILAVGLLCLKRRHLGVSRPDPHLKSEQGPEVYNSYRRTSPRQGLTSTGGGPHLVGQPPSSAPHPGAPHQHTFPRIGHLPKPPNTLFDQPENDYSRTWQMQRHSGGGGSGTGGGGGRGAMISAAGLPPPPPPATSGGFGVDPRSPGGGRGGYDQHVYESPKFERHELHSGSDEGGEQLHGAQYYELDPEAVPLDCGPAPVHSMRDVTGSSAAEEQRLMGRNSLIPHLQK